MTSKTFAKLYPTAPEDVPALLPLLDSKDAWVEAGDEVVGRASDGTVVSLGNLSGRAWRLNLAHYLSTRPTPATW